MKWGCSLQVAWPEWPDPRLRVGPGYDRPYVSAYEEYIYICHINTNSQCVWIYYIIVYYIIFYSIIFYYIIFDYII